MERSLDGLGTNRRSLGGFAALHVPRRVYFLLFGHARQKVQFGSMESWRVSFFPKALRRVLPENLLNTDTSTLTLTH